MSKKYSVFLVDDDKFLLDMYKRKFENDGASVEVAVGAEEALTKLRGGSKPDVLVFDIIMPGMDGLELLKVVRREKLTPDSAVVMFTNESDNKAIEEAKSLGIKGYIVKATTIPSEVIERIKKIANINTD
ncbi:MAG: two-component system sensor histidine kinase/response regulator [Candidatus Zambryskibacteria bacterium CG11_big_fil_rev_8_21_14_0_20_42_18]|uniref:Two-component system sensor histidine kinase/response regulator n=1 Tax=Candidatus Zambryskibacteria bacterium CG_4_9_14_3_um_filter_42_15 TaxID=1975112 RepID=A0A2M7WRU3_9BACT|nr:MAG: two-component system sensor histidine kinase/response regulator [Candidatus Zambryskibacteria bacterium CG11_big_fil_rev_8_21_14_0_20_42_18]PJA32721.1 MAG: two-component system sensor histidine kinase/response regulator [Candidatus Zambryskibacteria bacterium CG_4_9_14_3_um_filter_42_15]